MSDLVTAERMRGLHSRRTELEERAANVQAELCAINDEIRRAYFDAAKRTRREERERQLRMKRAKSNPPHWTERNERDEEAT